MTDSTVYLCRKNLVRVRVMDYFEVRRLLGVKWGVVLLAAIL